MYILIYLATLPLLILWFKWIKFCADYFYEKTNGDTSGIVLAVLSSGFPLILILQILVWTGVLK